MKQILQDTSSIDVDLLDLVVSRVYEPSQNQSTLEITEAQDILSELKRKDNMWRNVDRILDKSSKPTTHFFALQVLDDAITQKWNLLSDEEQKAVKAFLWNYIMMLSSELSVNSHVLGKTSLSKANCTLLHILKYEWPAGWPTFIEDLIKSMNDANTQANLFQNNFEILTLLSEENFNFGEFEVTSKELSRKQDAMLKQYPAVLKIGIESLKVCQSIKVASSALKMLEKYLGWVPSSAIHESTIIEVIGSRYLSNECTRIFALRCFSEIASQETKTEVEKSSISTMFRGVMGFFSALYPMDSPFKELYDRNKGGDADLLYAMAMFLMSVFQNNLILIENFPEESACGLLYLVKLTDIKNKELFKACIDYWYNFCSELCSTVFFSQDGSVEDHKIGKNRLILYTTILSELRLTFTLHMAKPEEIIIVQDENGDLQKEYITDGETIDIYQTMRQTLVLLAHLDIEDMENILVHNLKQQSTRIQTGSLNQEADSFLWGDMNTLCWAIGSISGAMTESHERTFFITVLRELLEMCASAQGKENKAVIASNIMYVVGQYPRFLHSHCRFLQTVANKLTEFMHESFPGVQDMAVDTFLKLARKCGSTFHEGEIDDDSVLAPYIETYLANLSDVLDVLPKPLIYILYEALGIIVSTSPQETQEDLIISLFNIIDRSWVDYVDKLRCNRELFFDVDFMQSIVYILKCMTSAGRGLRHGFVHYLHERLECILELYAQTNSILLTEVNSSYQKKDIHLQVIKILKVVKREILKVLSEVFSGTDSPQVITEHILPYVFDTILPDYAEAKEHIRDVQFLMLLSVIVQNLRSHIKESVALVCKYAIEPTLSMVSRNMHEYPDLRSQVFRLMRALTRNCFEPFLKYAENSPMIIEGILWATKHSSSEISSTGVETLHDFLHQVAVCNLARSFYVAYYITILTEIFVILTDTMHTSDFHGHVRIIHLLLQIASTAPQIAPDQCSGSKSLLYVQEYLRHVISNAYTNLTEFQINHFVTSICSLGKTYDQMVVIFRDFIIESKQWGSRNVCSQYGNSHSVAPDLSDLYPLSIYPTTAPKAGNIAKALNTLPGFLIEKHHTSYADLKNEDIL